MDTVKVALLDKLLEKGVDLHGMVGGLSIGGDGATL